MKGYTYLSSCLLSSGGTKWQKIVLNDCFDRGTLVGIQIKNHMIKCINVFYEYVKKYRAKCRNDDRLYIQKSLYHGTR